jgi:concanavalin A-like lectin/glucanase superfamily protein
VEMPNSPSLNISGTAITISMWVNITDSSTTDYVLISKPWVQGSQPYPYYQYGIEYDANGAKTLGFYFGDASGNLQGPFSMTPLLGTWTHVAYTYDGIAVKGYLDGVLKIQTPESQSLAQRATTLRIGVDSIYHQGYKGTIDDVRIYSRALAQAEIQQDMNIGVPPPVVLVPPVPDGTFGTPMTATRANAGGTTITLHWNTGCGAPAYHAIYGPLASVGSYAVSGGVCGIGTTGSASWTGVPAGNLWFLLVGDNSAGVEGSWGTDSNGLERNGTTASGVCSNTIRSNAGTCP